MQQGSSFALHFDPAAIFITPRTATAPHRISLKPQRKCLHRPQSLTPFPCTLQPPSKIASNPFAMKKNLTIRTLVTAKIDHLHRDFEYLEWRHPILGHCLKCGIYLLCCPCTCLIMCSDSFARLPNKCGSSRFNKQLEKSKRMLGIHFQHREHKLKRRESLSELRNFSFTKKGRRCDQRKSPLFAKLPTEIRLRIFGFVLNDESFLHVFPDISLRWKKGSGKFTLANCFVPEKGRERFLKADGSAPEELADRDVCEDEETLPWALQHRKCLEMYEVPRRLSNLPKKDTTDVCENDSRSAFLPLLTTCWRV